MNKKIDFTNAEELLNLCEAKNINLSPAQETIKRLSKGEIV